MSRKIYKRKGDTLMMTSQIYDKEGNRLIDVDALRRVCEYRQKDGSLTRWAYIIHDKDIVRQSDIDEREAQRQAYMMRLYREYRSEDLTKEDLQNADIASLDADVYRRACDTCNERLPSFVLDASKPSHLHLVILLPDNRRIDEVVGWFRDCFPQIPDLCKAYKDNKSGSGDRVRNALGYLIHRNDPQKHQYDMSEVVASFNYNNEIAAIMENEARHASYHLTADDINDVINKISNNQLALVDWLKTVPYSVYIRNDRNLDKAELRRQMTYTPYPEWRRVFYFECRAEEKSGSGKTLGCYHYALRLARERYAADVSSVSDILKPNPWVFTASAKNPFQAYAGQPVIIFDDVRGGDMVRLLGGRQNLKVFLSPHPAASAQDVKFSHCLPAVEYVLMTGITPYKDFIQAMAVSQAHKDDESADYEIAQYYRRIWGVCALSNMCNNSVDVVSALVNRDFYPIESKDSAAYAQSDWFWCPIPALMHSDWDAVTREKYASQCFKPVLDVFESFDLSKALIPHDDDWVRFFGKSVNLAEPLDLPDLAYLKYDGSVCSDVLYVVKGDSDE